MSAISRISGIGIRAINGKTRTSQRSWSRDWCDDEDASNSDSGDGADTDAATPQPQGVGRLIDKIA